MTMKEAFSLRDGWNWWVLAAIVLGAIVLGVLNNLRVYEDQRVPWFGAGEPAGDAAGAEGARK